MAWEAKVLTRAWWVYGHQVSKSAPTGEYLTTGSFMIRGKKNYLLPEHLQFGFSFLFRLEDSCIERHKDERKCIADDISEVAESENDTEIVVSDDSEDEKNGNEKLDTIIENNEKVSEMNTVNREDEESNLKENNVKEDNEKENDLKEDNSDSDSDSSEGVMDTHIKVNFSSIIFSPLQNCI